jgi:hypothetical protein
MIRGAALYVLLLASPAVPSAAQSLACAFDVECLDTEPCQPTAYELEVAFAAREVLGLAVPAPVLRTPSADVAMSLQAEGGLDGALRLWGGQGAAFHVLMRGADGRAVYALLQADPPLTITYRGRCEARP